jgi:hypothetical protein
VAKDKRKKKLSERKSMPERKFEIAAEMWL